MKKQELFAQYGSLILEIEFLQRKAQEIKLKIMQEINTPEKKDLEVVKDDKAV